MDTAQALVEKDSKSGAGLRATVHAMRLLVEGLAGGYFSVGPCFGNAKNIRYAPSYISGLPCGPEGIPYLPSQISQMLGNDSHGRAHPAVEVALYLLEMAEQGQLTQDDLERIYRGGTGLAVGPLLKRIRKLFKEGGVPREVIFC